MRAHVGIGQGRGGALVVAGTAGNLVGPGTWFLLQTLDKAKREDGTIGDIREGPHKVYSIVSCNEY